MSRNAWISRLVGRRLVLCVEIVSLCAVKLVFDVKQLFITISFLWSLIWRMRIEVHVWYESGRSAG